MKVIWSTRALTRLRETRDYIAEDNPDASRRFLLDLIQRFEAQMSAFPRSGRVYLVEPGRTVREYIIQGYRIAYVVGDQAVEVLTVWEGHRRPPVDDIE